MGGGGAYDDLKKIIKLFHKMFFSEIRTSADNVLVGSKLSEGIRGLSVIL